jgi:hypothetical protein
MIVCTILGYVLRELIARFTGNHVELNNNLQKPILIDVFKICITRASPGIMRLSWEDRGSKISRKGAKADEPMIICVTSG